MKRFFILLTLTCCCRFIYAQGSGDPYSGLGHLKPLVEHRIRHCGQIWVLGCAKEPAEQPTGVCQCTPYFMMSADVIQTVRLGGSVTLYCIFSGYPIPQIDWKGPQNSLPTGRHVKSNWDTTIILSGITATDDGNYSCSASNSNGRSEVKTLQLRVVAKPVFKNTTDGPYNITVTEGETVTFSCNPLAIPEANIHWLQNGQPIDAGNDSTRFVINDLDNSLTIRDVCRDCNDTLNQTDLMVIQCNASNVHGYAVASGYVNVLTKTKVTVRGPDNVSVDFLEEKQFLFQCHVSSDPSTPPNVRWYKTLPHGDLVRDEPPYVNVTNEFLIITIAPNCSVECVKYLGEYRCVGDNGYSQDNQTITLHYVYRPPPTAQTTEAYSEEETPTAWKAILAAGAICLGLVIVGICLRHRSKQSSNDVNLRTKEEKLPSPISVYEEIGYDSIGNPLEESEGNKDRSSGRAPSMYERIGYDTINQALKNTTLTEIGYDSIGNPLEESEGNKDESTSNVPNMYERIGYDTIDEALKLTTLNEESAPRSADAHGANGHASIDAQERDAMDRHRPMPDKRTTCDDAGYAVL